MKKSMLLLLVAILFGSVTVAQLKVASIFSDNMVLQRNVPLKIWGSAMPKTYVSVSLSGITKKVLARPDGKWVATLPKQVAGGPYVLRITNNKDSAKFENVLVGEVWLASGQSNMEWALQDAKNGASEVAEADHPFIREIKIPHTIGFKPQGSFAKTEWKVCTPDNAKNFSAIAYFFARRLHKELNVPVGIINSSWGGTNIEAWMSREAINAFGFAQPKLKNSAKDSTDYFVQQRRLMDSLFNQFQKIPVPIEVCNNIVDGWNHLRVPTPWEEQSLPGFDGIVWYKKTIRLDSLQANAIDSVMLGTIDDDDETFLNGEKIGSTIGWDIQRKYFIPKGLLRSGRNTICVKVTDNGGGGGFYGAKENVYFKNGAEQISLSGYWDALIDRPFFSNNISPNDMATSLFNGMINPLKQFSIKGFLWYQGESNVGSEYEYANLFPKMIADWRSKWQNDSLPFYFVQLSSFDPNNTPVEQKQDWAELRDAQTYALYEPNTAMVVTTDIGDAKDIHPKNKQDVGLRLANLALNNLYAKPHEALNPEYVFLDKVGDTIILHFSNIYDGLKTRNNEFAKGFMLEDEEGNLLTVDVVLDNDKIIIPNIGKQTRFLRYAWLNNAMEANIINSAGLPLAPFKSEVKERKRSRRTTYIGPHHK